jgi:hypothetical protein
MGRFRRRLCRRWRGAASEDRVSSRAPEKSGQGEGDTEDDPVGLDPTVSSTTETAVTPKRKAPAVSFFAHHVRKWR